MVKAGYAAAHGEGYVYLPRDALHHVQHSAAPLVAGVYVKQNQLVRALRVVSRGGLDRVARVAYAQELHALDHAPAAYVQTRYYPTVWHPKDPLIIIGRNSDKCGELWTKP